MFLQLLPEFETKLNVRFTPSEDYNSRAALLRMKWLG